MSFGFVEVAMVTTLEILRRVMYRVRRRSVGCGYHTIYNRRRWIRTLVSCQWFRVPNKQGKGTNMKRKILSTLSLDLKSKVLQ